MKYSALYGGSVVHRRSSPREHSFGYGLHLAYIDLEELPTLFRGRWFWSVGRTNLISFRREDYLGGSGQPLRDSVLDCVENELGRRPTGRVGVLTQLRTLGYLFNPVSFYFCYDERGQVEAIVAEITNTPWGERHAYVLDASSARESDGCYLFDFEKSFHISPFFPMEQSYTWMFRCGGQGMQVSMVNRERGESVFSVTLNCKRQAITGRSLAAALIRYPLQPLRLHLGIYWQAALLFLKRTPVFTHPQKQTRFHEAPHQ
jgi:uncharacterized protein